MKKLIIEMNQDGEVTKVTKPLSQKKEASLREAQLTEFFNHLLLVERTKNASLKHDNHILRLQSKQNEVIIAEMKELIVYAMHNSRKPLAEKILARKEEIKELIKQKEHDLKQARKMPVVSFDCSEELTFNNHNKVIADDDE